VETFLYYISLSLLIRVRAEYLSSVIVITRMNYVPVVSTIFRYFRTYP